MRWLTYAAIIALVLLFALPAFSKACVTITQSNDWENVKMSKGNSYFFTTKLFNISADGAYCEPATYEIDLKLENDRLVFSEVFDGNASPMRFPLNDGGSLPVLITLTPKVDFGKYTVLITAKRLNLGGTGTSIVTTVTAKINAVVGDESDPGFTEVPFWMVRKDCPGGYVVRQDEACPRLCQNGLAADEQGKCPEDKAGEPASAQQQSQLEAGQTGFFILGVSGEIFIAIMAVLVAAVALVFAFMYIRNLKEQLKSGRL
ncbi:MAG: hypothetical protein JW744_01120 [Candidatus Diapherotrites archaeon]|uniref:Uncharacterized protein n=1 Tax=Candidatus Iainarchaeum sp. TaxID=3101447 RepID=A0A938YTV5_9ARCH|nr:hypothetical protein [Candidatus Diapherotrites archaeon]